MKQLIFVFLLCVTFGCLTRPVRACATSMIKMVKG